MKLSGVDLTSGCEKQSTGLDSLYSIFQLYLAKHDPDQKVLDIMTSQQSNLYGVQISWTERVNMYGCYLS